MIRIHKSREDAEAFISAVAERQNWDVHPDREFVLHLANGLAVNYNRYGYYLCPCRDGDGSREEDKDIICPCDYVQADHAEYGHCMCGLFLSRSYAGSGSDPQSIPERRGTGI